MSQASVLYGERSKGYRLKSLLPIYKGSSQTLVARGDLKTVRELKGKALVIGTPGGSLIAMRACWSGILA
jgi:hypothetical protein